MVNVTLLHNVFTYRCHNRSKTLYERPWHAPGFDSSMLRSRTEPRLIGYVSRTFRCEVQLRQHKTST